MTLEFHPTSLYTLIIHSKIKKMSHLTVQSAHELIEYNRKVIYHLPRRYHYLNSYLTSSLRETALKVLSFLSDKQIIIADHQYLFIFSNRYLTHNIRRKTSRAESNRQMNLLCAIGLFEKYTELLDINKTFLENAKRPVLPLNTYKLIKYTPDVLERLESRSTRLYEAGITVSNFSYNMLVINGLEDIAQEALPHNSQSAPARKLDEYEELCAVMDFLISEQGYCTKEQIKNNILLNDKEIDKIFKIFKNYIELRYCYRKANKTDKNRFKLENYQHIFLRKEQCSNEQ